MIFEPLQWVMSYPPVLWWYCIQYHISAAYMCGGVCYLLAWTSLHTNVCDGSTNIFSELPHSKCTLLLADLFYHSPPLSSLPLPFFPSPLLSASSFLPLPLPLLFIFLSLTSSPLFHFSSHPSLFPLPFLHSPCFSNPHLFLYSRSICTLWAQNMALSKQPTLTQLHFISLKSTTGRGIYICTQHVFTCMRVTSIKWHKIT